MTGRAGRAILPGMKTRLASLLPAIGLFLLGGACGPKGGTGQAVESLGRLVPAEAGGWLVIDVAGTREALSKEAGAGADPLRGVDAELSAVFERFLGVDPLRTRVALAFVVEDSNGVGVVAEGPFGEPEWKGETEDVAGIRAAAVGQGLLLARVEGRLVVGNRAALEAIAAVVAGKAPALSGDAAALAATRGAPLSSPLFVGVLRGPVLASLVRETPLAGTEIDAAVLGLDAGGGATFSVLAAAATLDVVLDQIGALRKIAEAGAETMRGQAVEATELGPALGLTFAAHQMVAAWELVHISRSGGGVHARVSLGAGSGATALAVTGVLAAVAVPSFLRYTQRAKISEVDVNLRQLVLASRSYFQEEHAGPDGAVTSCRFPDPAPCTPAGSPCDHPGDRYPASAEAWSHPTWKALGFQIADPHRYQYCVESEGSGADARFTLVAHGDLDCDGVMSTFQRRLAPDPAAAPGACELGEPTVYVEEEGE